MPITLWSRLKIYFRMKLLGASTRCSSTACSADIFPPPFSVRATIVRPRSFPSRPRNPSRHDLDKSPHPVVSQPAEFRAGDFISSDPSRHEVNRYHHPRDRVLFQPQFAHEKGVGDVLGTENELHGAVHRNGQGRRDDVVFRGRIVYPIEAEIVGARIIDQLRVKRAEAAVFPG